MVVVFCAWSFFCFYQFSALLGEMNADGSRKVRNVDHRDEFSQMDLLFCMYSSHYS